MMLRPNRCYQPRPLAQWHIRRVCDGPILSSDARQVLPLVTKNTSLHSRSVAHTGRCTSICFLVDLTDTDGPPLASYAVMGLVIFSQFLSRLSLRSICPPRCPTIVHTDSRDQSSMAMPLPQPKTPLGQYRRLSPRAGVLVSPFQLGTMSLGSKWIPVGTTTKEDAFQYLDAYFEAGGNFIDTANYYQGGESEEWLGEWMEARGIRDQVVVATKYTGPWAAGKAQNNAALIGNNARSMKLSVDASLKKLRTTYIDILYVHFWDYTTSPEEIMDALHALVLQGKVIYLGVSNTQAFRVAQCNQYARDHGKTPFAIYQGEWNVLTRDAERDILPLCQADGMAFAPWNALCQGKLRTDSEEAEREQEGTMGRKNFSTDWKRNAKEKAASAVLESIAKELGVDNIRAVALAYYLQKYPHVFPILGGNKIPQMQSNIRALTLRLSTEQIAAIEAAVPFDLGFPLGRMGWPWEPVKHLLAVVPYDVDPLPQPIKPMQS